MPSWIKHSSILQHLWSSCADTRCNVMKHCALSVMCWVDWITADMNRIFQATVSPTCVQKAWHNGTQQFTLTPVRRACLNAGGFQRQSVKAWSINVWVIRPMSYFYGTFDRAVLRRKFKPFKPFQLYRSMVIMVVRYSTGFLGNTI